MRRFKLSAELAEATVNDLERTIDLDGMAIPLKKIKEYVKTIDREPVPIKIKTPFILNTDLTKRWDLSVSAMAYDHLIRFKEVDFSKPIIVLQDTEVLDGMHRVIVALNQGKEEIPGYILTMEELLRCAGIKPDPADVSASQEVLVGALATIGAIYILTPIIAIAIALPAMVIGEKISASKDKKNPTKIADRILGNISVAGQYESYPLVTDKDDNGEPMWVEVKSSWYQPLMIPSPATMRIYMKKVYNVITKFASLTDTDGFAKTMDATLVSEFGKDLFTITKSGLVEEKWLKSHRERTEWPKSPWYTMKSVAAGRNNGYQTEFEVEYIKWQKTLVPSIERIKKNVNDVLIAKPVDDKNEMAMRLAYIRFAYALLQWLEDAIGEYSTIAYLLSDGTPVASTY